MFPPQPQTGLPRAKAGPDLMWTPRLTISIFGPFDAQLNGMPANLGLAGATRSLLQYLVCSGGRLIRREQLMDMFWGDTSAERRRSSLNSAIWRIKKALRLARVPPAFALDPSADCLRLAGTSATEVDIDINALTEALADVTQPHPNEGAIDRLVAVLVRCAGTPLDGVDDNWAVVERERLSAFRTRALGAAMRLLADRRRYDESLEFGRRILLDDPFHEAAFQEVFCIHVLNGQRARALRLFDEFANSLERELGIIPMPETRALRDCLARGPDLPRPFGAAEDEPKSGVPVHPSFHQLVGRIESSGAGMELCS